MCSPSGVDEVESQYDVNRPVTEHIAAANIQKQFDEIITQGCNGMITKLSA